MVLTLLLATVGTAASVAQAEPQSLQAPSLELRLPPTPTVGLPEASPRPAPVEPRLPIGPSVPATPPAPIPVPQIPIERSAPIESPAPSLEGLTGLGPVARPGISAAGASAGTAGAPTARGVATRLAKRSEATNQALAGRRRLLRFAFDPALRGRDLQQLRQRILTHSGCLGELPQDGRVALELRAGLFGSKPTPQRVIARRIGVSLPGLRRLERTSLRQLLSGGDDGRCGTARAIAALEARIDDQNTPSGEPSRASAPARAGDGNDPSAAGAVLADVHEGGPGVDLGDGKEGPAESLLFFVLAAVALIGPLVVVAIARRRRGNALSALPNGANQRPLLFLDVDGVIVLDPRSDALPPGRIHPSPLGLSYVPDRTRRLVCELATRFDIVWTTGWEHRAAALSSLLGLSEDLPALTFGKTAHAGSAKWKIKPVDEYAGDRPVAWLDDKLAASHERWAARRPEPTLLVHVDARTGLTPADVDRLLRWADRVSPPQARSNIVRVP